MTDRQETVVELPTHPETDDNSPAEPARRTSRVTVVVLGFVAALVAVMVILHVTGVVGPGAH